MNEKKDPKTPNVAILSLNPSLDKLIVLPDPLLAGGLNRAKYAVERPGSKGYNAAAMLETLGTAVEYLSFTDGRRGDIHVEKANEFFSKTYFRKVACPMRENIKTIAPNGQMTEINLPGGPVFDNEEDDLIERLFDTPARIVGLLGSIPQGVEKSVYNYIIPRLHKKRKICAVDCDGEALKYACMAKPDIIKPNMKELYQLCRNLEVTDFEDVFIETVENPWINCVKPGGIPGGAAFDVAKRCGKIANITSAKVLCTLGADGAMCARPGNSTVLYCPAPRVKTAWGQCGAGDCFLGGYIHAFFERSYENEDEEAKEHRALRFAVSVGTAKSLLNCGVFPRVDDIMRIFEGTDETAAEEKQN